MTREKAIAVVAIARSVGDRLVQSIAEVRASESTEVQAMYAKAVGRILGSIADNLMEPLFAEHPEIVPEELRLPPEE